MIMFIYGADVFSAGEKIQVIKDAFKVKTDKSGLNIDIFDGEDFNFEKFHSTCMQSGFLATKRLIIVKNFLAHGKADPKKAVLDLLLKIKDDQQNIIIFWEQGNPKPDELADFLKSQKKEEFKAMTSFELKNWLKNYLQKHNANIEPRALDSLIMTGGNNLWFLKNELDKLIAHAAGKIITIEDLTAITIAQLVQQNIFEMAECLAAGQKNKALKILENQLSFGENELYLFSMIVRQFRIIQQLRHLLDSGIKTEKELADKTKLNPFVVKKILPSAKTADPEKLKRIYQKLLQCDRQLKRSNVSKDQLLEMLLLKI